MARKPLGEKTVAENCLKWGVGGINIDESRVGTEDVTINRHSGYNSNSLVESTKGKWKGEQEIISGRFPANLIHDGSDEVKECFPNESERFFKSIIYQAKASKSERNKGCEELEEIELRGGGGRAEQGYDDNDPEQQRLKNAAQAYGAVKAKKSNFHPTVKPIALMEYLIKMVTPKGGIVLDLFAGSGTTLVAAKQNGFQYIGVEITPEYIEIVNARLNGIKDKLI